MPLDSDFSMPLDAGFSMPLDADFSMPLDAGFSMPFDADFSMPLDAGMSMPFTCDSTYTCPDSCDCGGTVQDGGDICGCYSITSVPPPFDTSIAPASGTWYCYQVDLDKRADGCSDAKAVSHSVLATGFSESCLFHPGGIDIGGSDAWTDHTCDNTAATGLKYDFGQSGSGDQLSVTYCFDVSCEAAPAGEGSINWVLKAANDRCEIEVTDGAIPNCGFSSDLCHPSCSAGSGSDNNNGGGDGGNNGGGGGPPQANDPVAKSDLVNGTEGTSNKNALISASFAAAIAVAAIAGVAYRVVSKRNAAADGASLSSAGTPLA